MVTVSFEPRFEMAVRRIRDLVLKERVKKQIAKIIERPECGKPMRYTRKDSRKVRIPPFGLSYMYLETEDKIILLDFYHKDEQ